MVDVRDLVVRDVVGVWLERVQVEHGGAVLRVYVKLGRRRGRVAREGRRDPLVREPPRRVHHLLRREVLGVCDHELELPAEDAAVGVDVLDREFLPPRHLLAVAGVRSARRTGGADLDGGLAASASASACRAAAAVVVIARGADDVPADAPNDEPSDRGRAGSREELPSRDPSAAFALPHQPLLLVQVRTRLKAALSHDTKEPVAPHPSSDRREGLRPSASWTAQDRVWHDLVKADPIGGSTTSTNTYPPSARVHADGTVDEVDGAAGRRWLEDRPEIAAYAIALLLTDRLRADFFWRQDDAWYRVSIERSSSADGLDSAQVTVFEEPLPRGLTSRELDVLTLLGGGLNNKDIAARLKTSVRTVSTHVEPADEAVAAIAGRRRGGRG